jgi:hypothetical protein
MRGEASEVSMAPVFLLYADESHVNLGPGAASSHFPSRHLSGRASMMQSTPVNYAICQGLADSFMAVTAMTSSWHD